VEHSDSFIEVDSHPGPCSFLKLGPQPVQKGLDIAPLDVPRYGLGENRDEDPSLLAIHGLMIAVNASAHKERRTGPRGARGKDSEC
jgi:hypothetical protein